MEVRSEFRSPYIPRGYVPTFDSLDGRPQASLGYGTLLKVCLVCVSLVALFVAWVASCPYRVDRMHFETRTSFALEPPEWTTPNGAKPYTWVDVVKGNETNRPYCGPSFCFSSGSADCFAHHPAQLCMKAVYLCIRYIMSGQNEPQVCMRWEEPTRRDPVEELEELSYLNRINQWHNYASRETKEEREKEMRLVIPVFICFGLLMTSYVSGLFYFYCLRPRPQVSPFEDLEDPLLDEEGSDEEEDDPPCAVGDDMV